MTLKNKTTKLVLSAFFIALGIILPFVTMQIPSIGNMLLPMHIPILLCGFICGGPYGFLVGLITPLLRSVLFGMPAMMPTAISMAAELATYGLVTGVMYNRIKGKRLSIYISLIIAMILGRMVWGVVSYGLFAALGNAFTWQIFLVQGFANAIPGIIIQLIIIPAIMYQMRKVQVER
ncbi:ECF transporter S component [Konateibacter massiliensis]|uniref:ECF transporter S component n=1 Tax=Konateibacter massiliensis TaxID=2002841 RepID=UPI000C14B0A5|nr:ECF transporter S component [Konateibacter massiliensis]